jgi:hypothetical protein
LASSQPKEVRSAAAAVMTRVVASAIAGMKPPD